jgi:hypothetical protein
MTAEPRLLQLDPFVFKSRVEGMMSQLYLPRKQVCVCICVCVCVCLCIFYVQGGGHDVAAVPTAQAGVCVYVFVCVSLHLGDRVCVYLCVSVCMPATVCAYGPLHLHTHIN